MDDRYTMEKLVSTFDEHAEMNAAHQEQVNEAFLGEYPDRPLPIHMADPFSISKALSAMCAEIHKIKQALSKNTTNGSVD